MAYTEKVSLSGTALSFLMYECINSSNSQEGFLIGEVTSEVTNHISDSQSDNTRLDTQIIVKTVLPLPSVSLFYLPTGRIREDVLTDILSGTASEIVGWYKYRKNTNIKPTFRDKLIARGLQKYFEKHHNKKTFVTCNVSNKSSSTGSTHTFTYRFGKINCLDMYEYIEDVTANLGEKLNGYRKGLRHSPHSTFNKIIKESNIQNNNTNDAILSIQEAVNVRLVKEATIAAKNESTIKELEAEIKQMSSILSDKLSTELQTEYDRITAEKFIVGDIEMVNACVEAMKTPSKIEFNVRGCGSSGDNDDVCIIDNDLNIRATNPILTPVTPTLKPTLNYAAALKNRNDIASTSKMSSNDDNLISFDTTDDDDFQIKKSFVKKKYDGDSSPDY